MKFKFTKFRWANDQWTGTDKVFHLARDGALFFVLWLVIGKFFPALLITQLFAILWEVKDGFVRWEDIGWWGGDGFSYKDILMGWVGIMFVFIVAQILTFMAMRLMF